MVWCWAHQREVQACHRRCAAHNLPMGTCRGQAGGCHLALACTGEPVTVSGDSTGERSLVPDRAAADLAQVRSDWATARAALDRIAATYSRWPAPHRATPEERRAIRAIGAENAGDPGCWSCARTHDRDGTARWVPPFTQNPSTVHGLLAEDEAKLLCRWCYDHVAKTGMVPNVAEVAQRHDGRRVVCRHPKLEA